MVDGVMFSVMYAVMHSIIDTLTCMLCLRQPTHYLGPFFLPLKVVAAEAIHHKHVLS